MRLRRRLTIAFTLVAGLAALALAAGSYAVVRQARLSDSVERSLDQARFNLELAAEVLASGTGEAARAELLEALERRGDFETVGVANGEAFSSSVSLGAAQVPRDLRTLVRRGDLAYERVTAGDVPYLAVGGRVSGSPVELYFLFSEEELRSELAELRNILLAGVGVLALLAAITGAILARRMLAPVGRASEAARSLAEGLLDTRLDVERADEFGTWAASFNEMADALEAKITALSEAQARERRFTADVAHELRTPLTALVAEASLLAEHLDRMPPDARRPAELVVGDVARLRRLVDDLMEISRLDAGAEPVRREPVDVGEVVAGVVRARGADDVTVEDGGVRVWTDPRRIERIVSNLLDNALEHGSDTSVRVALDGDSAVVEVADRGPGIPAEHVPHVFERFYKADPSRTRGGSGLGLAIARENALALGADLDVASEVGRGARFTLRLPVAEALHGRNGVVERDADASAVPDEHQRR